MDAARSPSPAEATAPPAPAGRLRTWPALLALYFLASARGPRARAGTPATGWRSSPA